VVKVLGCGYTDRCWAQAEKNGDVALVYGVDQSLARTLHSQGVRSRRDLLASFDVASLSEVKRPYGNREQRVGKTAERILRFADAHGEEPRNSSRRSCHTTEQELREFDLEGMPPHLNELDKIYLWGAQAFGENPSEFKVALSGFGADGDRDGWIGFLDNAKQIFEPTATSRGYIGHHTSKPICVGTSSVLVTPMRLPLVCWLPARPLDSNEGLGRSALSSFSLKVVEGLRRVRAQGS